ncbi:MAG: Rpp14/Pop5 family protein [Halorientalis sp.]
MKHLPKHLRPRWRYLAIGIESWPDADVGRSDFQRHLWYAAQNLFGDPASADLDLTVIQFELRDGQGSAIVRTRRGEVDRARAAVACLAEIDGDELGVRVRGVSGTVRACEEKYLRTHPESTDQRTVTFEGDERTAVVRDGRYDVPVDSSFAGATELDFE